MSTIDLNGDIDLTEKKRTESNIDVDKSIVLWSPGDIQTMELNQGFNLHRLPKNYLARKSHIEKLIYHATMSDRRKSLFSGFKIADEFLHDLDNIDIISGIKSLKSFIQSFYQNNRRISTMIHRIGNTWLLNEFDVDSFLLTGGECRDWVWLREFLAKQDYRLCLDSFSRKFLVLRDLESKFLYHTVSESPELDLFMLPVPGCQSRIHPQSELSITNDTDSRIVRAVDSPKELEPSVKMTKISSPSSRSSTSDNYSRDMSPSAQMNTRCHLSEVLSLDRYLQTARWQLQDMSFLVGSDLPIFGTPKHPCISLKLSPKHESINVLTGIDIWLENIINEVPEVAMCYHHEGIVMQEYEIYKTCEIPSIVGFETEQMNKIVRNLIMFLKRNATQEGHTYWLVKEPGIGVVKLYDLTTMGYNQKMNRSDESSEDSDCFQKDRNPFILPVATIFYKLAELRVREYTDYRKKQLTQSVTDNFALNETTTVIDALRLLKNCLNLISVFEKEQASECDSVETQSASKLSPDITDLKYRAILLLCKLYLITPSDSMNACLKHFGTIACQGREAVSATMEEFSESAESSKLPESALPSSTKEDKSLVLLSDSTNPPSFSRQRKEDQLGSMILEALKSSNTSEISKLATSILTNNVNHFPCGEFTINSTLQQQDSNTDNEINDTDHKSLVSYSTNLETKSRTRCLPFALLKSYIDKSEKLWLTVYQQLSDSNNYPFTVVDNLHSIFRLTLPALLLLEHLIPDNHINFQSLSETTAKPSCPSCGRSDVIWDKHLDLLEKFCLKETLFVVSCLYSASVVSYPEALRRTNQDYSQNNWIDCNPSSSDLFIMQLACPESISKLALYISSSLSGPIISNQTVNGSVPMDAYEKWLKVISLAACCFRRVVLSNVGSKELNLKPNKIRQNQQQNKLGMSEASLFKSNPQATRLHISVDWWPALVNMYVYTVRMMWVNYGNNIQDDHILSKFDNLLDMGLKLITDYNINSIEFNSHSQFLAKTNEFQLYKLLALFSQYYPNVIWAKKLYKPNFIDQKYHLLPLCALYIYSTETHNSEVQLQLIITKICLARAIESLLQYHTNMNCHHQQPQHHHNREMNKPFLLSTQFYLDILLTANEYFTVCLEKCELNENDSSDYLDNLNTVLKQVLRFLPTDLTPNSVALGISSQSEIRENDKTTTKEISRALVNLRLHQLKLALKRHNHGVTFRRGKSQTPAWSSIISQTRTTLQWHMGQLSSNCTLKLSNAEKFLNCLQSGTVDLQDLILYITLVSHLVNLQTVNRDILSVAGINTIFEDIHKTEPILQSLKNFKNMSNELYVNLQCPMASISDNLTRLCVTLEEKFKQKYDNKSERGSSKKHKAQDSSNKSYISSPEHLLISEILKLKDDTNINPVLGCEKAKQTYDKTYTSLTLKLEHLSKYLGKS